MTRTHEPINTAQERAQILWAMCEYVVDVRKNTQATTEEREYVGEALMAALRLVSLMEGSPEPHEATQSLAEGKAMEQRPGRPQKTSSGRATARQKEETANDGRATNHSALAHMPNPRRGKSLGRVTKETKLLESVREASRAYFAGATTVQDLELLLSIMETAGANAVQTFKEQEPESPLFTSDLAQPVDFHSSPFRKFYVHSGAVRFRSIGLSVPGWLRA